MEKHKNSEFLGIDWSKKGWVFCYFDGSNAAIEIREKFSVENFLKRVLVDIPIGILPDRFRICDMMARKLLKERKSSIYPVPPWRAIITNSYKKGLCISRKLTGKGFSKQLWNIRKPIIEVNLYLREHPDQREIIYESHPELCLKALCGKDFPSKHTPEGIRKRIEFLKKFNLNVERFDDEFKKIILDVIDACILAISATFLLECVCEKNVGVFGITPKICYPAPDNSLNRSGECGCS